MRFFWSLLGALLLVAILPSGSAEAKATRPNFVVVQLDDLSLRTLGMKIGSRSVAPYINGKLGGLRFKRFYANTPVCAPSRASLLTGSLAHNHGVRTNDHPTGGFRAWKNPDNNIGTWLQRAGYRTAHFGKLINDYRPGSKKPRGWSRWATRVKRKGNVYYGYRLQTNKGIIGPIGSRERKDSPGCRVRLPNKKNFCKHATDLFTAYARREIQTASKRDRPFFIALNYNAPHDDGMGKPGPEPPSRLRELLPKVRIPKPKDQSPQGKPPFMQENSPASPALLRKTKERLRREAVSVRAVDQSIARIAAALRRTGEAQNTYIIITSDNGFFAGEHRIFYGKFLPYDPATHQPFIVSGPGIQPGKSFVPASTIDIAPTILDLAIAKKRGSVDGISLAPALRRKKRPQRLVPLESFNKRDIMGKRRPAAGLGARDNYAPSLTYRGFISKKWKYIKYLHGPEELYKVGSQETRNLAQKPRYQKVIRWARKASKRLSNCRGSQECRPKKRRSDRRSTLTISSLLTSLWKLSR